MLATHPPHGVALTTWQPFRPRIAPVLPRRRVQHPPRLRWCRNAAPSEASAGAGNLYTLAQLQAASKQAGKKLADVSHTIQQELQELQDRIPVVVRAIWGKHCESVVDALKQQQQLAGRLIRQWEMAEHRLIAVANSLSVSSSGQVR
jgi:hypothetical protein